MGLKITWLNYGMEWPYTLSTLCSYDSLIKCYNPSHVNLFRYWVIFPGRHLTTEGGRKKCIILMIFKWIQLHRIHDFGTLQSYKPSWTTQIPLSSLTSELAECYMTVEVSMLGQSSPILQRRDSLIQWQPTLKAHMQQNRPTEPFVRCLW